MTVRDEDHVRFFESEWMRGRTPIWECVLPLLTDPAWVVELVCIDLEFRWKQFMLGILAPDCPLLYADDYLARIVPVFQSPELQLTVFAEEFRVRTRWGNQPDKNTYNARLPNLSRELLSQLANIERELLIEYPDTSIATIMNQRDGIAFQTVTDRDYLLQRMIGVGATSKVYRAWSHHEQRPCALKFLRKPLLKDSEIRRRFLKEAQYISRLQHPGIVRLHHLGFSHAGTIFLDLDLIVGESLEILRNREEFTISKALNIAVQIASALAHSHDCGIIHGDLKPANILMDGHGNTYLADFGFGELLHQKSNACVIGGTKPFIAPELLQNLTHFLSPQTDIYSFGLTLFLLLTKQPPLTQHVTTNFTIRDQLPPGVPNDLRDLVELCLHSDPGLRPESMSAVLRVLKKMIPDIPPLENQGL